MILQGQPAISCPIRSRGYVALSVLGNEADVQEHVASVGIPELTGALAYHSGMIQPSGTPT